MCHSSSGLLYQRSHIIVILRSLRPDIPRTIQPINIVSIEHSKCRIISTPLLILPRHNTHILRALYQNLRRILLLFSRVVESLWVDSETGWEETCG